MTREERANIFTRTVDFDTFEVIAVNLTTKAVDTFTIEVPNATKKSAEAEARAEAQRRGFAFVQMSHVKSEQRLGVWELSKIMQFATWEAPRK